MAIDFSTKLATVQSHRFLEDDLVGEPQAAARALADVQRAYGLREEVALDHESLASIRAELITGALLTRRQLIDAAYGLALPFDEEGSTLLAEPHGAGFDTLIAQVEAVRGRPRLFRRVYGGLFSSYLTARPQGKPGRERWESLRAWLDENLARLDRGHGDVALIVGHRNLLTDDPCSRYARDADREIGELRNDLRVPQTSWVFGEIVVAQVRDACSRTDDAFAAAIDNILKRADEFPALEGEILGAVLNRYADAAFASREHRELRDRAIALWGNPFDRAARPAWKIIGDKAREMVENWVKQRVMDLFFSVIAKKHETDQRRSAFWGGYLEDITDFHLFLGGDVYSSRASEHVELRELMRGKFSRLDGDSANNGFLMFIGDIAYLEFSVTGNACYVYDARDLPVELDKRFASIKKLKDQELTLGRMFHQSTWEWSFKSRMKNEFGYRPRTTTK